MRVQSLFIGFVSTLFLSFLMVPVLMAETYTVTTTADDGAGSLRQAMTDASAHAGADTIVFNIPDSDAGYDGSKGIWVIKPQSELPELEDRETWFNGWSQRDFISGDPNPDGPEIVIDGSEAGTATGLDIRNSAALTRIDHLTVFGFVWDQIRLHGDSCTVTACYVGTAYDGQSAGSATSGGSGILLWGSYNLVGGETEADRNIISGNIRKGIDISDARHNRIAGNYIGVNVDGTAALPNYDGIQIRGASWQNEVGPGNVIAGNTINGIVITGNEADTNRVFTNYIGTNTDSDGDLGNGEHGIRIDGGNFNMVGGEYEDRGNIIAGNGRHGIALYDSCSFNDLVWNKIGVASDGETALPNLWNGVDVHSNARRINIGPFNTIANCGGYGVSVQEAANIRITQNSIYSNTSGGIMLGPDANSNMAAPVITRLGSVIGTAPPGSTVEIFSTDDDQGRNFEDAVTADGSGNFSWAGDPAGPHVTATATDANGNTSEFSGYRIVGAITVTNTLDDGDGSLRSAIGMAEANAGPDTLRFAIPTTDAGYSAGTGVWTIRLLTDIIMDGDGTYIDGFSQRQYHGSDSNPLGPEIAIIPGSEEAHWAFDVNGNENGFSHLALYNFTYAQIVFDGSENLLKSSYLCCGTDGATYTGLGMGIWIRYGSGNVVGGPLPTDGNVISGISEHKDAINIYNGSVSNTISHNILGLDKDGDAILGCGYGIDIDDVCADQTIGPGNIISGNHHYGITIHTDNAIGHHIFGNKIGTDITGTLARGNEGSGVILYGTTSGVTIGGSTEAERNIISGNGERGIYLADARVDSTFIMGNYIGTDVTGTQAMPNGGSGIEIYRASHTIVGGSHPGQGNVISSNGAGGVYIYEPEAQGNRVIGNRIGLGADDSPLPNEDIGVTITLDSHDNTIGPGNTIAHHSMGGIYVMTAGAVGNTITRNSIYSNSGNGIVLSSGGNANLAAPVITGLGSVHGTAPANSLVELFTGPDAEGKTWTDSVRADASGSWTSALTPAGPYITATATDAAGNTSAFSGPWHIGPYIVTTTADDGPGSLRAVMETTNTVEGPDTIHFAIPESDAGFDGTVWRIAPSSWLPRLTDGDLVIDGSTQDALGNSNADGPDIFIDGRDAGDYQTGFEITSARNVIKGLTVSGFDNMAIEISGDSARHNLITGCWLGLTPAGDDTVGHQYYGVYIRNGAKFNTIGGGEAGDGNVISGNGRHGCYVRADSNWVAGNLIGTDFSGETALGNLEFGVLVYGSGNVVGSGPLMPEGRNIISGNVYGGISMYGSGNRNNTLIGNTVGLNRSGDAALPNGIGIYTHNGAARNRIAGNLISGNSGNGLEMTDTDSTEVFGNAIGVNAAGDAAIPNLGHGLYMYQGAACNMIGAPSPYDGNVISGNGQCGIFLKDAESNFNVFSGNVIGENREGGTPLPNGGQGILINHQSRQNFIGPYNTISHNGGAGIEIQDNTCWGNTITANSIYGNTGRGIDLSNGGNHQISSPVLTGVNPVTGTADPGSLIEIYSDDGGQGRHYEDSLRVDDSGQFTWAGTPDGPFITATRTVDNGNTSEFSDSLALETAVEQAADAAPATFALHQNYPNPFNPETTIQLDVAQPSAVLLRLYDVRGRLVKTLVDETLTPGVYQVKLQCHSLASGVYLYKVSMGDFTSLRKLIVLE